MRQKRCLCCKELFQPDNRAGNRQKVCGNPECRRYLKRESQKKWATKNPDYNKRQYEKTKVWLADHPNYLSNYRNSHPEYVERNRKAQRIRDQKRRLDIQDEINAESVITVDLQPELAKVETLDIRDEITPKVLVWQGLGLKLISILDIQDQLAAGASP